MSKRLKVLLDLANMLSEGEEGSEEKAPPEEPKYTEADLEKARAEILKKSQEELEAAQKVKNKSDDDSGKSDEEKEGVDGGDVIDYESEFKEQQSELIITKVSSGLGVQGVEVKFEEIAQFFQLESLKDEKGRPSQEKIDELVTAITEIATKTPPRGKKRTERKPGMAAYLDEA